MKITPNITWQEYKEIRVEAIKTNPEAFANILQDVLSDPDKKWQGFLELSKKLDGELMLFALDDSDQVIGMLGAYWVQKPKLKHIGNVFGVFVKPEFRGKGIGTNMLMELIKELRKVPQLKKLKLEVVADEIPAIKLYKKVGFKEIGISKEDLFQPETNTYSDLLIMEMAL